MVKMPKNHTKGRYNMQRVKAACLTQILHFVLKEDASYDYVVKFVELHEQSGNNFLL